MTQPLDQLVSDPLTESPARILLAVSIEDVIRFPSYLDEVFLYYGLTILIIGAMAFATSGPRSWKRRWGRWLVGVGALFALIGFNPGWLLSLLKYMIP